MRCIYGSYNFGENAVKITLTQRAVYSRGRPFLTRKRLTLDGELYPATATQAAIKTKIVALESAFSVNGQDCGLLHDNGTRSAHYLDSSSSIGGTKVLALDYPDGSGRKGQYATQRSFHIEVEADYPVSGADFLISFNEKLEFQGDCGPRGLWVETLTGPPQLQTVNQRTTQIVTQQGNAVGYLSNPFIPAPIFPGLEHRDRRRVNYSSPILDGNRFVNWGVSWSYTFESAQPLFAQPNRR